MIKPHVKIKFPWYLSIGDHCWIGERVWIDNLCEVRLGDHVCVSQGVYFCTGSHNWLIDTFDLEVKPILLKSHSWICAQVSIAPGTEVSEGTVVTMNSLASGVISEWNVYSGTPARLIKARKQK